MHQTSLLSVAIALLGATTLWQMRPTATPVIEPTPTAATASNNAPAGEVERRLAIVEDELTREILLRQELERRLRQLEESDDRASGAIDQVQPPGPASAASRDAVEPAPRSHSTAARQRNTRSLSDNLLAAGLPADTVQNIKSRIENSQLQLLELRNQAVREGWDNTSEYVEKAHELQNGGHGLREDFGDDVYDKYLFASGSPNRIRVREVFRGSAADLAGIRTGDVITSYASSRVFTMGELRDATTEGIAGENLLIEVLRDGVPVSLTIPRGAIGISMEPARIKPAS